MALIGKKGTNQTRWRVRDTNSLSLTLKRTLKTQNYDKPRNSPREIRRGLQPLLIRFGPCSDRVLMGHLLDYKMILKCKGNTDKLNISRNKPSQPINKKKVYSHTS